jgi:hypothetical protein
MPLTGVTLASFSVANSLSNETIDSAGAQAKNPIVQSDRQP